VLAAGQWRIGFDIARGSFLTSHVAECPDVAPECATTFIPPHKHVVRVGLTHYETTIAYGLRNAVQLSLRLPYDVKAQRVRYTTLDGAPFTPPYGDIHHRTETLRGISDATLMLDRAFGGNWTFGVGTTLPIGHTVPDPVILGREGLKHEHLQFGTGTFEPIVAAQFANAKFFARAEAKISAYESSKGYKGPTTIIWSLGPTFRIHGIGVLPQLNGQRQSLGYWQGELDEGSGFQNGGVRLQLSIPRGSMTFAPAIYRELWSHGLGGQTFRQSTTWSASVQFKR
jgi:hypothetical protein